MFGYIKPLEDELKVRELKLYRAIYCGLCNTSKNRISRFSRFFLSFDYTFFALVHMIFTDEPIIMEKAGCGFHLFAKKEVLSENSSLTLSSAIFSVLTYYKLRDTVKDEDFLHSLGARLLLPFGNHIRKKAIKNGFSEVDFIISDCLEKISRLEKNPSTISEDISCAFGEMMGHLMKIGVSDSKKQNSFTVGFEVGNFIYLADAIDDLYTDSAKGSFNPLLCEYGSAEKAESELSANVNALLHGTDLAADIISSMKKDLSDDGKLLCNIAQNILYLGCPAVVRSIFQKNEERHPKG